MKNIYLLYIFILLFSCGKQNDKKTKIENKQDSIEREKQKYTEQDKKDSINLEFILKKAIKKQTKVLTKRTLKKNISKLCLTVRVKLR